MDIAPSTSENTTVYVVGNDVPTIFPEETDFLAGVPDYEDRYRLTKWVYESPLNTTDVSTYSYTPWPIDKWLRPRSMAFYHTFQSPIFAAEFDTSITPLPGMGVTAWDEVNWNYGSTGLPVIQQNNMWPHNAMISFFGDSHKNKIALNQWRNMAGFYDFKTFDYLGGQLESYGRAGDFYNPFIPTPVAAPQVGYASRTANDPTVAGNYMVMPPYYNRARETGFFIDPEMQRMRVAFKGNRNCQFSSYLVRSSYYTKIHDTYTIQPPLKQEIKFKYTDYNRPRFINTPQITAGNAPQPPYTQTWPPLTAATIAPAILGPDVAPDASLNFNYKYTPNLSYLYYQVVELRSDIHQAFLDMWANTGSAFVTSFISYSMQTANNIVNTNKIDFDLITRYGNIPYKTLIASVPSYGVANVLPANTNWPPRNTICEFAYGDNHVSQYLATVTHPYSRTFTMNLVDNIGSGDPWNIVNVNRRGVMNPEYWVSEKFNRTQGMENPDFVDCDSLSFQDYWDVQQAMPIGSPSNWNGISATPNEAIVYGSHSILPSVTPGNLNAVWNVGMHNNITTFFWPPPGFEDENKDYGVYKGSVRISITFSHKPPIPLNFFFLNCYRISFIMIGNGTCNSNIQIA